MGLQLLHKELLDNNHDDESKLEMISKIETSCETALAILNDLLVYDKLDSGILKLELQRVHATEFLMETIEPFYLQVCINHRYY